MADSETPNSDNKDENQSASQGAHDKADLDQSARRGGIATIFSAFKNINEASITDQVRQRISDYISIALVALCILALVVAVALPAPSTPNTLRILPLVLTICAVFFYMMNRVGIIASLTTRQALIVWQILIAAFWLGVTSAMLVIMCCFYMFGGQNSPIQ